MLGAISWNKRVAAAGLKGLPAPQLPASSVGQNGEKMIVVAVAFVLASFVSLIGFALVAYEFEQRFR